MAVRNSGGHLQLIGVHSFRNEGASQLDVTFHKTSLSPVTTKDAQGAEFHEPGWLVASSQSYRNPALIGAVPCVSSWLQINDLGRLSKVLPLARHDSSEPSTSATA